jgi:hypothetical protein
MMALISRRRHGAFESYRIAASDGKETTMGMDFSGPIRVSPEGDFRFPDHLLGISVHLQVEHKQLIGNGHLIGSSLR